MLKKVKVVESKCMNNEVTLEELDNNLRIVIFNNRSKKLSLIKYFEILLVNKATVCPGSLDPFYMVRYYIKWVKTS